VATHEESSDRAKIVAAGHAAASWARARRATWTNAPLARPQAPAVDAQADDTSDSVLAGFFGFRQRKAAEPADQEPFDSAEMPVDSAEGEAVDTAPAAAVDAAHAPSVEPARVEPEPVEPVEPAEPAGPPLSERAGEWIASAREPAARWLGRIAAAAALVAVAVVAAPYAYRLISSAKSVASQPAARPTPPAPSAPTRSTGTLAIKSTPDGARVIVDGAPRGTTPVTLPGVAVGRHTIVLESSAGTIERSVTVTADAVTDVDESIFSGFVTIYSPFEVTVTEGARALRPDDRNEIMLPPGRHELRVTNRRLGFDEVHRVELKPGQRATISIGPQRSSISVTATEPGEVWIDGARFGDTPLADAPLDLGTHVVVVRRTAGGERRFTITATVKPITLHVDFARP